MHVYFTQNKVAMKTLIFVVLILGLTLLACSLTPHMPTASKAAVPFPTKQLIPSPISTITKEPTNTPKPTTCTVIAAKALHLRDAPTIEGKVIAWLFSGEILTISSDPLVSAWVKVTRADGTTGFVNSNFCEVTQ